MSTPSIERECAGQDGREGLLVRTPFDRSLVDQLKAQVPRGDRYWTGEAWWVAPEHQDLVVYLLHKRWPEILFYGLEGESDFMVDRGGAVTEQGRLF